MHIQSPIKSKPQNAIPLTILPRKRIILGIILLFVITAVGVITGCSLKALILLDTATIFLSAFEFNQNTRIINIFVVAVILTSSAVSLFLTQFCLNESLLSIGIYHILTGMILILALSFFLATIIGSWRHSTTITMLLAMLLATACYYVYQFRGSELMPVDILSIGTALNVASNYSFIFPAFLFYAWALQILWIFAIYTLPELNIKPLTVRIASFLHTIILILLFICMAVKFPHYILNRVVLFKMAIF